MEYFIKTQEELDNLDINVTGNSSHRKQRVQ